MSTIKAGFKKKLFTNPQLQAKWKNKAEEYKKKFEQVSEKYVNIYKNDNKVSELIYDYFNKSGIKIKNESRSSYNKPSESEKESVSNKSEKQNKSENEIENKNKNEYFKKNTDISKNYQKNNNFKTQQLNMTNEMANVNGCCGCLRGVFS